MASDIHDLTTAPGHLESDAASTFAGTGERALRPRSDVEQSPKRIGDFLVEDQLGSGGMGTVYRAVQLRPIRRTVALKVIRREAIGPGVVERFLAERQTLARMDHQDIAKVLGAGTHEGQPFFAMEYADGQPVDRYADEHRLSVDARARLAIRIARAIDHAHQRGVLHRDIKPDNVLVTGSPDEPVVKVIDFGIAKDEGNDLAVETQAGEVLGTPAFMAPEQVSGDVDARSDVYSLGAMLFRLLTGRNVVEFPANAGLAEILAIIGQNEPPSLVSAFATLEPEARDAVAANCSVNQRQLLGLYRRELGLIVAQAIAPDRINRYATAGDFADDLERSLRHEPVRAVRPTVGYRLRKYVRRHRPAVVGAAAVVLTALAVVAVAAVREHQTRVAQEGQDRIDAEARVVQEQRQRELEEAARQRAEQLASEASRELAVAEAAFATRPGSRAVWESDVARGEAALGRAAALIAQYPTTGPDYYNLVATRGTNEGSLRQLRAASTLVDDLNKARDGGTGGEAYGMPLAAQEDSASVSSLKAVLGEFGISVRTADEQGTEPVDAAEQLSDVPDVLKDDLIDALDFLVARGRRGIGVTVDPHDAGLMVRLAPPGFVADADIYEGDVITSLQNGSEREELDGSTEGWSAERAYRAFAGRPGTQVTLSLTSTIRDDYSVTYTRTGHEAYWSADVLAHLDGDARRTQQRRAILDADIDTLRALATRDDVGDDRPFTLVQLAQALEASDDQRAAVRVLRLAQQKHPSNFWTNYALANALAGVGGESGESTRFLTAAAAIRPDSRAVNTRLAMNLAMTPKVGAAISQMQRVIAIEPSNYMIRRVLVSYLRKTGRYAEALATQRAMVEIFPDDARAVCTLGYLYGMNDDFAGEIANYKRAVELKPDEASYRYRLIVRLRDQGRDAEADAYCERVLTADAPNYEHLHYQQTTLGSDEEWELSATAMKAILDEDPTPFQWHRLHGYAALHAGDPWAAIGAFQEALRLQPGDEQIERWCDEARDARY